MKLTLMAGAAALVIAAAATGAHAESPDGWYGAVDLGYHELNQDGIKTSASNTKPNGDNYDWKFGSKGDWAGFARLGYRFTPHVRVELEGGYRKGDLKSVMGFTGAQAPIGLCSAGATRTTAAPACGSPSGKMDAYTVMANGIYDFFPHAKINPFIGVGVGVLYYDEDFNGQFATLPAGVATQNLTSSDTKTVFAYQGLVGLSWQATEKLSVDLTYRELDTANVTWKSTSTGSVAPGTFSGKYQDGSLTLGLRYAFASPPPPPPPAATSASAATAAGS